MTTNTRTKILIVEDEALVAEDLRSRLQRMDYEVVGIVDRAEDVVASAQASAAQLVLLDIKLKGVEDGIAAGKRLREQYRIPFVFVTSHADRATLDRACRTEPFGYVTKPFDERAIQAAIEMALSRHRAERSLEAAEQWMRTILRNIGDAVVVTDAAQRITFLNDSGENLSRWPAAAALGQPFQRVFPMVRADDGAAVACPVAAVVRTRSAVRLEEGAELVARDGTRVPVDDAATPIRSEVGEVAGTVVILRDCRERLAVAKERHRAQHQIQEARRLESLGRMAGGLAHDFNNMLTAVLGNAELLARELAPDGRPRQLVTAIERSARAAAGICERLRHVAAETPPVRERADLAVLAADTIALTRVLLGGQASVVTEFGGGQPSPAVDRIQIQQVLINLLVNAAEAFGGRPGTIAVRTGFAAVPPAEITVPQSLPAGAYAFLEVADDGPGMTAAVRDRVFDPFFSTKGSGRGLGLSGALGIVRMHGGGVLLDSTPGRGTTLRVLLPLELAAAAPTAPAAPAPAVTARPIDVALLVVDDDPLIRSLLLRLLEQRGIQGIEASSAERALELLEQRQGSITAALVDVQLPGRSGIDLLDEVQQRWPAIAVALMTGSPDAVAGRGASLLAKPFSVPAFDACLLRLLPQLA